MLPMLTCNNLHADTLKTLQPKPLAIVIDGSVSMCGYFLAADKSPSVLDVIKQAMIIRDTDIGRNVYVLRQKTTNKNKKSLYQDIVPADSNFLSQAGLLNKKPEANCSPFDGVSSNLEFIFDEKKQVVNNETFMLLTDAQLKDADRDVFISGYRKWAESIIKQGKTPYAGYAIAQTNFEGVYYPVSKPNVEHQKVSYLLKRQPRPLALFWFSSSKAGFQYIEQLVGQMQWQKPIIQQLLPEPIVLKSPIQLSEFSVKLDLASVLAGKGDVTAVKLYDPDRSERAVVTCISPEFVKETNTIQLNIARECPDGKALWDGVHDITYTLKLKPVFNNMQLKIMSMDATKDPLVFTKKIKKNTPLKSRFEIQIEPLNNLHNRTGLGKWSIDTDYCQVTTGNNESCDSYLFGKTYQLDLLSQKLVNVSNSIDEILIDGSKKIPLDIEIIYKNR